MNSLQAFSQSLLIAGYCLPHFASNSVKRSLAPASEGAVYRPQIAAHLIPVLARGEPECVADQMDHARLDGRELPCRSDRLRQALQAITDGDADIVDAAVLDLGEHAQPELRALAAASPAQRPRMSRSPLTLTPITT